MKSLILHKFACKILPLQLCLFSVFLFAVPFQSTTSSALSIGFCGDFPGKHNNTAKFHPFLPPPSVFPRKHLRKSSSNSTGCDDASSLSLTGPKPTPKRRVLHIWMFAWLLLLSRVHFRSSFFSAWKRLVKGVGESVGHNTSLSNSSNFQCQHISLGKTGIFWVESRVWYMDKAGMGILPSKISKWLQEEICLSSCDNKERT